MTQDALFDALYLEMYDMLLVYATQALDRHHALAEEAVQDTFRICWIKFDYVIALDNQKGWLLGTLKNVILNIRRSQARSINLLLRLQSNSGSMTAPDELDFETEHQDLADDPDYQLLKELALDQRTITEIAQKQGITVIACKKRIQRAKERLKKYFEKNQN